MINQQKTEIDYLHELLNDNDIFYEKYDYSIEKFNIESIKHNNALKNNSINKVNITVEHAELFYSYFKGRPDVFSKRGARANPKTGITAYYSQCDNFWKEGLCPRIVGQKILCRDCKNQKYTRLKRSHIIAHLKGEKSNCSDVVGLYPIFEDNTCNFLAFDFDNHDSNNKLEDFANSDDK